MDTIDASSGRVDGVMLTLAASIPDGRIRHNIHRVTSSACRMAHLFRLISLADVMTLWRDFYERQSAWFSIHALCRSSKSRIFNFPRSGAGRLQARPPRSLSGLCFCAAENIAQCSFVGSIFQSAGVRAVKRRHAPTTDSIFAVAHPLIDSFHLSLAVAEDGVLPPCDSPNLFSFPESTQKVLSQAVFQKRLRDALRNDKFRN